MPIIRARQPRNQFADKSKHSQPLNDIEPEDRENSDDGADQGRADKALVSRDANNQAQPQERKTNLDKNAERDVHENARRRGWYRRTMERRQPRR